MEGWATFVESYLVAAAHGAEAERAFWDSYRNHYERNGFEGGVGILTDYNNRGVAYSKGAWIFRMLRDRLGEATFLRGLRAYMDTPEGQPAGIPSSRRPCRVPPATTFGRFCVPGSSRTSPPT